MKNWKKLKSEIVHSNPWYIVRKDDVIRPNGDRGEYYVVETRGPSVFIVATNSQNQILLIGMERYTNSTFSWEIPGGNSDNQDPKIAALRELQEETGYTTNNISLVGKSYVMNGVCGESSYVFHAKNLIPTGHNDQGEEGITKTKWVTQEQIKEMIKNEEITDNQTIVAITKTFFV